jgi:hypothetical protein
MNAYHALRAALRAMLFPSLKPFDSQFTALRAATCSLRAGNVKQNDDEKTAGNGRIKMTRVDGRPGGTGELEATPET